MNFQSNTGWRNHLLKLTKPWDDRLDLKGVTCLQELEILKNFAISKSFDRKWGATAKYSKSTPQLFTFPFFFFCFLNHCSQHWVLFLMASFSFTLEWFCSVDLSGVESLPWSVSFSHCFQAHFFSEFELGVYSQFPMVPGTYFFLAHKEDFLSLCNLRHACPHFSQYHVSFRTAENEG